MSIRTVLMQWKAWSFAAVFCLPLGFCPADAENRDPTSRHLSTDSYENEPAMGPPARPAVLSTPRGPGPPGGRDMTHYYMGIVQSTVFWYLTSEQDHRIEEYFDWLSDVLDRTEYGSQRRINEVMLETRLRIDMQRLMLGIPTERWPHDRKTYLPDDPTRWERCVLELYDGVLSEDCKALLEPQIAQVVERTMRSAPPSVRSRAVVQLNTAEEAVHILRVYMSSGFSRSLDSAHWSSPPNSVPVHAFPKTEIDELAELIRRHQGRHVFKLNTLLEYGFLRQAWFALEENPEARLVVGWLIAQQAREALEFLHSGSVGHYGFLLTLNQQLEIELGISDPLQVEAEINRRWGGQPPVVQPQPWAAVEYDGLFIAGIVDEMRLLEKEAEAWVEHWRRTGSMERPTSP